VISSKSKEKPNGERDMEKLRFAGIENSLSRDEMRKIMAGFITM